MNPEKDAASLHHSVNMLLKSMLEFFREFEIHPETEFRDSGNLKTLLTGVPHPILNSVMQTSFDPITLDADIQNTINIFKDKAVPFSWYIWPNSSPENLADRLQANGLTCASSSPGMIADLTQLPDKVSWADGLEITMVISDSMMADWLIPINQAFQLPEFVIDFFVSVYNLLGLEESKPTRHYVAYLDRKPVASSTVYLGSDRVAGIWNVATTVESRGKGIGTAVTWKPLQEVVKEGYTHAVLRSSQMGYNVYKRLGFEEVFKDRLYIW